jgi:hypothetical protein
MYKKGWYYILQTALSKIPVLKGKLVLKDAAL